MSGLTAEQERAVERRDGSLTVRAGAGTGKTTVLVERFVRAAIRDEVPVEAILAITFTEKAAAEMKTRVRRRLLEEGRRDLARAAESAWISTIHGFCASVLRAHALSAGIDPDFRVLDELESERLALDAFDGALEEFMADAADPARIEMVAAYTPDRLRDMVRTAYSHLRSRGQRSPRLEETLPPARAGELERFEPAARAALAELGRAGSSKAVDGAIERLERALAMIGRLEAGELPEPAELDRVELRGGNARALSGDSCRAYRDALAALRSLVVAEREQRDHTMLRALLALYDERYEGAKVDRSGLDFEDLELATRDLFAGDEGLKLAYSERFEQLLVDEFQDTNPLQNELLELLARDNLFRVGDENQSIYRFRNADISVFRGHWNTALEAGRAESVTINFRARGEVLDAIDMCFERTWGERFEPLREAPRVRSLPPKVEPCVELLVVDRPKARWDERFADVEHPFGEALHGAQAWRAAEARLLAKRIDELTRDGPFDHGDVVLLFRATTAMGWFEQALEERGIPVHVVGGRGYWGQQQVADLRNWLSALANPLDEIAVYSVLASPLAGLSLDAVALIGLAARRLHRDVWWTVREPGEELLEVLPAVDRRRLLTLVERLEGERGVATQVSLETLIDRAVTRTGYDRHLLALHGGARRMANVRKLMRMAREYEADEGRDLRGFVDRIVEQDALERREGEAPLEGEAGRLPVRMMTVHRAKGLEFPVVCVCDLGKEGRDDEGSLRISEDGRVGLRLAGLGGSVSSETLERIKEESKLLAEEEERRIFYVAATRAQQHLILSGATDLERRQEPSPLSEPMRWIWRGLCPGLPAAAERPEGEEVDEREGREVRVRFSLCSPESIDQVLPASDRAPLAPAGEEEAAHQQPELELGLPPAPRALPVSRLSYTGLEAYRSCGYRFYLQRALGLAPVEPAPAAGEEAAPREPGMTALLRGSIVHELLERLDFRRPQLPSDEELAAAIERHGLEARPEQVADLRAMVERVAGSALCERIGNARAARAELPFAFTLTPPGAGGRSLLVNGVVDVHVPENNSTLVVDWKSDALDGREPEEVCARSYSTQRLVYALAALRAGAERVEVLHCFLERPDEPARAVFEAADAGRLEAELLELARGVVEARFEPSDEPHHGLCADCPGRAALCVHGPELTLRPVPAS